MLKQGLQGLQQAVTEFGNCMCYLPSLLHPEQLGIAWSAAGSFWHVEPPHLHPVKQSATRTKMSTTQEP